MGKKLGKDAHKQIGATMKEELEFNPILAGVITAVLVFALGAVGVILVNGQFAGALGFLMLLGAVPVFIWTPIKLCKDRAYIAFLVAVFIIGTLSLLIEF